MVHIVTTVCVCSRCNVLTNLTCHNLQTYIGTKLNAEWNYTLFSFCVFFFCPLTDICMIQFRHPPYPSGSDKTRHFRSCMPTCLLWLYAVVWLVQALGGVWWRIYSDMPVSCVTACWYRETFGGWDTLRALSDAFWAFLWVWHDMPAYVVTFPQTMAN